MNRESLNDFIATHGGDPAILLLAETAAALRADPDFLRHEDDVAGAVFLGDETPATLAADALGRVMTRIGRQEDLDRRAAAAGPARAEIADLPSPVREAALAALDRRSWWFGGLGVRRLPLTAGQKTQAELMRIEPGRGAARHDHDADELTLVLTGAYSDGSARYEPGDVSWARPGFSHTPKAELGDICYVLAVTYGPPRFQGLYGFLQRTIGFPWSPKAPRAQ